MNQKPSVVQTLKSVPQVLTSDNYHQPGHVSAMPTLSADLLFKADRPIKLWDPREIRSFPGDVNRKDREIFLLRVPGFGVKTVNFAKSG